MGLVAALLFLIAATQPVANQVPNRCASPAAATGADALAAKFDDHQFVFIGSTPGDRMIEEFLMCLVYIDAFVYLGPEPDKDMTGSIPLTAAQQRELERRNAITSDQQRTMRARFQGRDQWFRAHPNDFPARPN